MKFRESFRPFAPLILAEECSRWFDTDEPSDYMQYTANLIPARRHAQPDAFPSLRARLDFPPCEIASVVHVDYSARIQTVHRDTNPRYHAVISAFKAITGCPVVVNTSFNVRGEPIVCTPEDAFKCFMGTEIELLVCGNAVLRKQDQDPALAEDYKSKYELD